MPASLRSGRSCRTRTERKGTPDAASFEVVFEKTSPNPNVPKPYYVDGKMKCDLPG